MSTAMHSPIRERDYWRRFRTVLLAYEQQECLPDQPTQMMPALRLPTPTSALKQVTFKLLPGIALSEAIGQAVLDFTRRHDQYPTAILFSRDIYFLLLPILRQDAYWEHGFPILSKGSTIPFACNLTRAQGDIICLSETWT